MAPVWIADEDATLCMVCGLEFGRILPRRHHCRACGVVTLIFTPLAAAASEAETETKLVVSLFSTLIQLVR